MYYRLNDNYALRAWKFVNNVIYHRYSPNPICVDKETFELLRLCDGEHDIEESDALKNLTEKDVIALCRQGEHPSEWSRYRKYEHRYMLGLNLMITGKCNYNCLHCFNSSENADRMEEWDYDALIDLFDQATDCGVHNVTLTGGEPMLHPRFTDIVRTIYERNMVLDKLTTNGHFFNEDTVALFKEVGASPQMKISFDGIGHHDWLRRHPGAEEAAIRVFKLCAKHGFRTKAQMQVNQRNLVSVRESLCLMEEIGVNHVHIIPTIPLPRWEKNVPGGSLSIEEYFGEMLDLAEWYLTDGHTMSIDMWRYLVLFPKERSYKFVMVPYNDGKYRPTASVCHENRIMMAITCEGNAVPCLQMSDCAARLGQTYDSLKKRRLADILTDGEWSSAVCMNHHHFRQNNKECDSCEWFGLCGGGCRALGVFYAGLKTGEYDYTAPDRLACLFFKSGWYDRVKERLSDYELKGAS